MFQAKKVIIAIVGILHFFAWAQVAYAGFGITPPYVRSEALTRGSEYTQEIILVRGDPIDDLQAEITVSVPDIDDWFQIDLGNEFVLPAGKQQVPMKVTVTVPEDAKYGTYEGTIRVRTSSVEGPSSGVSLALGAQIDVDLRVVDRIRDFDIRRVELTELEEGFSKWFLDYPGRITFGMYVENTGNARYGPSKVRFDIYDKKGGRLLESTENINDIGQVAPFQTQKVSAYLPTWLPAGGYLVKYEVYKEDQIVKQGQLTLSVLPPGTVPGYEPFGFEALALEDKLLLGSPIALVLLLIVGFVIFRSISKRRICRPKMRRPKPAREKRSDSQKPRPTGPAVRAHGSVVDLSKKR